DAADGRGRAFEQRRVVLDRDAHADELRALRLEVDRIDLADRNAREGHAGPFGEPFHRLGEEDVVMLLAAAGDRAQPDHEDDEGGEQPERDAADEDLVRTGFHQTLASSLSRFAAARPLGPPKYSWIQG